MHFTIVSTDPTTNAREGLLGLPHGEVATPQFMPVGTNATVKAIAQDTLEELGVSLILGNTYHLYLRPGIDVIRAAGGLHRFAGWNRNILTDSGGYQVFSLAPFHKITEAHVSFRSHIDGSSHRFTPEGVIDIQRTLGSDIAMVLDFCTPPGIDYHKAIEALDITTSWARRSVKRWETYAGIDQETHAQPALFGIVQGNFYEDLRARSAEEILELNLPGIAIGGLSVGEEPAVFRHFLAYTADRLPLDIPRYVMGIGTPEYVFEAVENGIDLFDCVYPTRIARNAAAFSRSGIVSLKQEQHRLSSEPIDNTCGCRVCARYSRAYLRHLYKSREILAAMLTTEHNLYFMMRLLDDIRAAIRAGRFAELKRSFLDRYTDASGGHVL